jgi:uncharacterized protein YjdB
VDLRIAGQRDGDFAGWNHKGRAYSGHGKRSSGGQADGRTGHPYAARQIAARSQAASSSTSFGAAVNLTRCSGRPVTSGGSVWLGVTDSSGKTSTVPSDSQNPPGTYDFALAGPNPTPNLTVPEACEASEAVILIGVCQLTTFAEGVVAALTLLAKGEVPALAEALELLVEEYGDLLDIPCTSLELPSSQNPNQTVFLSQCEALNTLANSDTSDQFTLSPLAQILECSTSLTAPPQVVSSSNPQASFSIDAENTGDCSIQSVAVTPNPATVAVGSSLPLQAQAYDGGFSPVSGVFAWTSDDTTVAIVGNSSGVADGVSAGTANITAEEQSSKISGSTPLTVSNNLADRYILLALGTTSDGVTSATASILVNGVSIAANGGSGIYEICNVPDSTSMTVEIDTNADPSQMPAAVFANFTSVEWQLTSAQTTVAVETDTCASASACTTAQELDTGTGLTSLSNACVSIPGVNLKALRKPGN